MPHSQRAATIARRAVHVVGGPRKAAYGDAVAGYEKVAAIWNGILTAAGMKPERPLDAHAVATLLEGLKIGRRYFGGYREDNYVDSAGYAAIAGEIAHRTRRKR